MKYQPIAPVVLLLFSAIFLFAETPTAKAQILSFEERDGGLLLLSDGKPRLFYQMETISENGQYPRANYLHPVFDTKGEIVTEDFPKDHLHHRGIFWTWHQLWVDDLRIGDPWISEGVEWEVKKSKTKIHPNNSATIELKVIWKGNKVLKKNIIEENTIITFQSIGSQAYKITFDITLKPLTSGVRIGGSEDAKGYGGFSPRIKLSENAGFFDENGPVTPDNLPVAAGDWINITKNGPDDAGVVIMGEPDKLPSYQGWILRKRNSMQNMAFPGQEPLLLDKKEPLHFRNQLIIHQGMTTQEIINQYRIFRNQANY
ncbi:DUF6807 family protein [Cyclobacterium amurskyense]|uniref:DUF6807 family protein n=1 Tax=Cyclobacterium amurskyense TaxID=320787 RepID=UPI0030D943F6|tara:strand:+ start:62 stop:1006 length:945 start_codon:yes stop_codon:yes gene_type:complete